MDPEMWSEAKTEGNKDGIGRWKRVGVFRTTNERGTSRWLRVCVSALSILEAKRSLHLPLLSTSNSDSHSHSPDPLLAWTQSSRLVSLDSPHPNCYVHKDCLLSLFFRFLLLSLPWFACLLLL